MAVKVDVGGLCSGRDNIHADRAFDIRFVKGSARLNDTTKLSPRSVEVSHTNLLDVSSAITGCWPPTPPPAPPSCPGRKPKPTCNGRHSGGQGQTSTYRRSWATLLARVFRIDVTNCPDCGGRMKIIAALTDPSSIRRCLQGMRLPARAPPIAPARPDPQPQFDYA